LKVFLHGARPKKAGKKINSVNMHRKGKTTGKKVRVE
jgi:hypothetical protein